MSSDFSFIKFRKIPGGYEVDDVFTAETQRRQGVAKMILQFLLSSLNSKEFVWLEVHKGNRAARKLYHSLGFVEVGERANYYPDGGAAILCEYKPLLRGVDSAT